MSSRASRHGQNLPFRPSIDIGVVASQRPPRGREMAMTSWTTLRLCGISIQKIRRNSHNVYVQRQWNKYSC